MANKSYDNSYSQTIVKKISDQALLANIAKTSHKDVVQYEAVRQLTDPKLLSNVVENAKGEFKQYAMKRLAELTPKQNQKVNELLTNAAFNGNSNDIIKYLNSGADANAVGQADTTALGWTCYNGVLEAADELIKKGADVNKSNRDGETPLMSAAKNGRIWLL